MIRFFSVITAAFAMSSVSGQCDLTYTSVDPLCNSVCDGQATVFPVGSAPFDYTWSTGDNAESLDSLCAGTYTVTMVDDVGCSASVSITITEPSEPFIVDAYLISNSSVSGPCEGQIGWTTSGGQPDYTINWFDCNTMNLYTNLPYFCAGEYFSVFIDDYGCIDTSDCITVTNNVADIQEKSTSEKIAIYPNPFQEIINLDLIEGEISEILVYDFTGHIVHHQLIFEEAKQVVLSDLKTGIYNICIITPQRFYSSCIIKG